MNTSSIVSREPPAISAILGPLLCAAIGVAALCQPAKLARAVEPANAHENVTPVASAADDLQRELLELLEHDDSTQACLDWLKRAYIAGELNAIAVPQQLPWTTWTYAGWRLELTTRRGEKLILAAGGGALVAIRQGSNIEMSALDLSSQTGSNRRSRYANGASMHHVSARSPGHLATKSPYLAPLYFYFVGPTSDVLPSQVLPPPAFQMFR